MDAVNVILGALQWLQSGQRWNMITLAFCIVAVAYVVAKVVRRIHDDRQAARAVVSDSMRIAARRYHDTAWS